ncbi:YihY/virulence factor BrkB family protein [[Mycoplasma] gypis]|uniref:YihY/virulence factor BrkB family protein n=1 Tax=[Mycoplasma] gypis TaxID=92404 RepID=A0ABZ2RWN7_9BACT|nr:YihY/virulence factor BrkB family protein [[Mycoplasma] gypis]MBN0919250.1 YihY/virulence factor BrkB family protein [[Mycoplasma] gypis]
MRNKKNHIKRYRAKNFKHGQAIKFSSGTFIFERILKTIIFWILKLSIRDYMQESREKTQHIIDDTYKRLRSKEFMYIPAGSALYLFISFVPIVTLVSSIGFINSNLNTILRSVVLGRIIPGIEKIVPDLSTIIKTGTTNNIVLAILFVFSALWLSSRGYAKFIDSVSIFYDHKGPNRFLRNKIKALWIVISLTLIIFIVFLIFSAFMWFLNAKAGWATNSWQFLFVYYVLAIFFIFVIFISGYIGLFKFAPNFKLKYQHVIPGAFVSAIPSSIFTAVFGTFVSLGTYDKWGAVSSFMYLQIFLLFMSYFTYVGLLVNASFYRTFISNQTIPKKISRI